MQFLKTFRTAGAVLAAALLAAVVLTTGTAPAQAGEFETQEARCYNDETDPNLRIGACTWLLNSGQVAERSPPLVFFSRGIAYADKGLYDRAILDFDQAIRLKPDYAMAFNNRGSAYRKKGLYDRAILDFDQAIRLKPDYAEGYNNLAWLLATTKKARYRDGRRAVDLAQKAVSLKDIASIRDTLAAAFAEAGRFADAAAEQRRAINMLRAAGRSDEIADHQSRLYLYRQRRPYRK